MPGNPDGRTAMSDAAMGEGTQRPSQHWEYMLRRTRPQSSVSTLRHAIWWSRGAARQPSAQAV